ncbi:MAG: STAS/SEC14 domain-containing protein [Phycisphaerae bacterium]
MTVQLIEETGGKVLEVDLSGKLTKEDYKLFVPEIERLIDEYGKLRILVKMEDFHGWNIEGLWEDIKVDLKHFNDVERIAFVGEKTWEKGMSIFCKPFTSAEVKYFDHDELGQARAWIEEGLPKG